jgi:amidase
MHSEVPVDGRRLLVDGRDEPADRTVSAWSRLTNLTRGPATVVPAGLAHGGVLPVGAQLLGAAFDDRTTVAVARLAQDAGAIEYLSPQGW